MKIVSNGDNFHDISNPALETIFMKCQILLFGEKIFQNVAS